MRKTVTASAATLLLALATLVIPALANSSPAGADDGAPAETYYGKNGYSLRLGGHEAGFNDQARPRAIVIHGADYATPDFIARFGRLGRSWGCPALDPAVSRELIDTIKGGSVVFGYYPDRDYLSKSAFAGDAGTQALWNAARLTQSTKRIKRLSWSPGEMFVGR